MSAQEILADVSALAADFAARRHERQRRTALDPADFEALRQAGFHRLVLPEGAGGPWLDPPRSVRSVAQALCTLAQGDSSVALVCAMHPGVVSFWLSTPEAPAPHRQAWRAQREAVLETVRRGDFWGTVTSEAGSGGDILRTKAVARPDAAGGNGAYRLSGAKQFGSGSGIMAHMITTALPEGETQPDWFFVDFPGGALDESAGVSIAAPWDGHGMAATQSHALTFRDYPATRIALPGRPLELMQAAGNFIQCQFASVIVGIVTVALETARADLRRRKETLRPFEVLEWAHWEREGWLVAQAYEGMLRAVEQSEAPRREVLHGKLSLAHLAESVLTRLCRVMGGGTFSRHSPYGFWFEDVRALGFLRPSWGLAYDNVLELL